MKREGTDRVMWGDIDMRWGKLLGKGFIIVDLIRGLIDKSHDYPSI